MQPAATHPVQLPDATTSEVAAEPAAQRAPADPRSSLLQRIFFRPGREITQEQGQALTRVVLAGFGTLLFLVLWAMGYGKVPFLLASVYLLASFLYLSFVSRRQAQSRWRRYAVILLDLGIATLLTAEFSAAGIAFYPLFLWVMIGNGLRYGEHYLQVATLFGLLGFTGAMAGSGFLWSQPGTYIGLMFGLVLMPKFFLVMIDRLGEANRELQLQKEQAEYMATHDMLTDLPNRAYLHTRMEQVLAHAKRSGHQVAVAFIDLDAFKSINDSFGHEYGDFLLTQVADAMRAVLRAEDTVARLGGDEFVVVMEDYNDPTRVGRVIERLFSCVGRYYRIGEYETYVTWSCGVVIYPNDGDDVHTLLKHADTAMYAAKARGPNHYAFYDAAMSDQVSDQLALRDDLRLAIEKGQFELYYQPIVNAVTGRIDAAEALLRWHHPKRGLLAPGAFIEVAEQSGLINPIGDWVLREALVATAEWQACVDHPVAMHVNVSAHQLKQEDFADRIRESLETLGLPPQVLDLEMTESALLEDERRAETLLAALKGLGVKLALDDFGTGFSSLSYLKRLPVDTIKIDKSFIDDIPHEARDRALVEAILTLGRELGTAIVAEGVEHARQRDWLRRHGCTYLQGYHFSRPIPREDFLTLARAAEIGGHSQAPTVGAPQPALSQASST